MLIAAARGNTATVEARASARYRVDVAAADRRGMTAVMAASQHGHADTIEVLASRQQTSTLPTQTASQPYWLPPCVEVLARLGADVNAAELDSLIR